MNEVASSAARPFRILTLDGGGAKGFYTLGVLKEIEALVQTPLHERFDLVFGTSTGAIIAALLALGKGVDDIHKEYRGKVPEVMRAYSRAGKSRALAKLAVSVFGDATFSDAKVGLGIVAARWDLETPMIFKRSVDQAHGRRGSFMPGFGCTISEAVQASCSAYPFFERKVLTVQGSRVEVIDGGYCANNPTLYAIADALMALGREPASLRVISVGVGSYPDPKRFGLGTLVGFLPSVQLLQKTLDINTNSMDRLRAILFKGIPTIRISDTFEKPEMATDFLEHDLRKLDMLYQQGRESFAAHENQLKEFLL